MMCRSCHNKLDITFQLLQYFVHDRVLVWTKKFSLDLRSVCKLDVSLVAYMNITYWQIMEGFLLKGDEFLLTNPNGRVLAANLSETLWFNQLHIDRSSHRNHCMEV